jgi:hypothetical protein
MKQLVTLSVLCALVVLTAGCGSGVKTIPVIGTVTYKNAPVAGAQITLTAAKDGDQLKSASATTDANGKFSVKSYFAPGDERTGAMAGVYKVTLQKIPASTGIVDPYKPGGMPKNELPGKYSSPLSTPFEKEVKASGGNDWQLDLVD